jgi:hypothetical protein
MKDPGGGGHKVAKDPGGGTGHVAMKDPGGGVRPSVI